MSLVDLASNEGQPMNIEQAANVSRGHKRTKQLRVKMVKMIRHFVQTLP